MKVTLKVEGMKCGMCEAKVNKLIRDVIPNAKKVKSNRNKGISTFVADENSNIDEVVKNITSNGYNVSGVEKA